MSWQVYVDQSLCGTGLIAKAAIHSLDGAVWATSADFSVKPSEVTALVSAITSDASPLYNGIYLGGKKFTFLRTTDRSIYGKLGGDAGCIICKGGKCVLIGIYENGVQPGAAVNVVEKLCDYLVSVGF